MGYFNLVPIPSLKLRFQERSNVQSFLPLPETKIKSTPYNLPYIEANAQTPHFS